MDLNPQDLEKFKDCTLLYILHSKGRESLQRPLAQLLFKKRFKFHSK